MKVIPDKPRWKYDNIKVHLSLLTSVVSPSFSSFGSNAKGDLSYLSAYVGILIRPLDYLTYFERCCPSIWRRSFLHSEIEKFDSKVT
jgi:hypothetical protein